MAMYLEYSEGLHISAHDRHQAFTFPDDFLGKIFLAVRQYAALRDPQCLFFDVI